MGRLSPSLTDNLNIKDIFCKDLLKSIRFYLILIGQKEQKSHYKHITVQMLRTIPFFHIPVFFLHPKHAAFGLWDKTVKTKLDVK